jgi:hypothetical protein
VVSTQSTTRYYRPIFFFFFFFKLSKEWICVDIKSPAQNKENKHTKSDVPAENDKRRKGD